jgi:endo-1,4-beta-D-glucanase Y
MTTTKINTGLYQFTHKGRTFQVENINTASDGDISTAWMVYEMRSFSREYLNDYATKRAAVARTIAAVDAGY